MSILSEPRRKQKIGPDPQNTAWQNDSNKFGQKMLERMGWKSGMGLGAKNQGTSDPVELQATSSSKGLGCKRKYDDTWMEHQDDFQNVLAQLSSSSAVKPESEAAAKTDPRHSLEARSKKSKARVHYHKFTRGKDLSRYSSTDLTCILGNKDSKGKKESNAASSDCEVAGSDHLGPLLTTNQEETVAQYFTKKTNELRSKRLRAES